MPSEALQPDLEPSPWEDARTSHVGRYHDDETVERQEDEAENSFSEAGMTGLPPRKRFRWRFWRNAPISVPAWLSTTSQPPIPHWLPTSFKSAIQWTEGPEIAQNSYITGWFSDVQEYPLDLINWLLEGHFRQALALCALLSAWCLVFTLVLHAQTSSGEIGGYKPSQIWCGASFWDPDNACGLDGNNCRPFNNDTLAFKCPANCAALQVLEPRAVGDQELLYQQFVIGGPSQDNPGSGLRSSLYRADSFICQAALHAGIINDHAGGCGVAKLTGEAHMYKSSASNGISSVGFNSTFPKSFVFVEGNSHSCGTVDQRWPLFGLTLGTTILVSLFTSSVALFFSTSFTLIFFQVALVSDPPNISDYATLISICLERFLPAAFCAVVIYSSCVRPQLTGVTAQIEKTILYLGPLWVGSLSNYTFGWIPIQRLTPHDLKQQPGAITALIMIVVLIFAIALGQVWYLRQERRLRQYLAIYSIMGILLVFLAILPGLRLRIHHYILALLLLPGTRTQTRAAMIYQGLLIGLFINGVARWGFASIVQTDLALGTVAPSLLPNISVAQVQPHNLTFEWELPPENFDGISVLVNDVERHRWFLGEGEPSWTYERPPAEPLLRYFRFAFMRGSSAADYTKAGVWNETSWIHMRDPIS